MRRYFDHQIPFALDSAGRPVSVNEVPRGLACGCKCSACNGPLIANKGERRLKVWHFSHQSNKNCVGALESSLHIAVKEILEVTKQLLVPPCVVFSCPSASVPIRLDRQRLPVGDYVVDHYKYTANPEDHSTWTQRGAGEGRLPAKPKLITFDDVSLEQLEGAVRPDIVCSVGGRKIYLEVAVTHFIDNEKLSKLRARNTPTIELVVPLETARDWNWETLKSWLIKETAGKFWVLNPIVEALADADQLIQLEKRERRAAEQKRIEAERAQIEKRRLAQEKATWEAEVRRRALVAAEREAVRLQKAEEAELLETKRIEAAAVRAAEHAAERERYEAEARKWAVEIADKLVQEQLQEEAKIAREQAFKAKQLEQLQNELPSPSWDPSGIPVLFLDYDGVIKPGDRHEQARLQRLANNLRNVMCSIIVTSRIRLHCTPEQLAERLSVLGGRHVGATMIIDSDDSYGSRAVEVLAWLKTHDVPAYCIIDSSRMGWGALKVEWVSTRFGLVDDTGKPSDFNWWRGL